MQNHFSAQTLRQLHASATKKSDLAERKKTGIFYTPPEIIEVLTTWSIRKHDELILEPSFGGCGFLLSSRNRLLKLGNMRPETMLYGSDIDDYAFDVLDGLFQHPNREEHFRKQDFLSVQDGHFPTVDVVIGNPPYISWHNMTERQRSYGTMISEKYGITRRSSLWLYFILHSLTFLKEGGRMAWILPGSFLFSDYSLALRDTLDKLFKKKIAIYLQERIFIETGTEETSVVLLCEGYHIPQSNGFDFCSIKGIDELESTITKWTENNLKTTKIPNRPQQSMISTQAWDAFAKLEETLSCTNLGAISTIRIGIVTGANRFFIINESERVSNNLPEDILLPIIAKFSQTRGIVVSDQDLSELRRNNERILLINCDENSPLSPEISNYLMTYGDQKRLTNYTFKNKKTWYKVDDGKRPDGFFSSMTSDGPLLILNDAKTTCSNTVYQIYFHQDITSWQKKAIAIAMLSTFTQFSAEIEGRVRSGGALKLEPSEVGRLKVLIPPYSPAIEKTYGEIDNFIRKGNRMAAQDAADKLLLSENLLHLFDLTVLREALNILKKARKINKK